MPRRAVVLFVEKLDVLSLVLGYARAFVYVRELLASYKSGFSYRYEAT